MSSIDVIIPCYRYGCYLRQCVQSVLSQGVDSIRVLIIDDASPDDTAVVGESLAAADPRVSFIRHEANRGHIATYNEGIEQATADYLLLLSADDYLSPGSLLRSIGMLDADPAMGLVFGGAQALFDDGSMARISVPIRAPHHRPVAMSGETFIHLCAQSGAVNLVPTPTAVVRTEYLKRFGGYLPELPHSGDLEMWLRLAAHSNVGFIPAIQAVYRRHAKNMSLDYQAGDGLADLQQRKAAFDTFIEHGRHVLATPHETHQQLLMPLAEQAVERAGEALVAGRRASSDDLARFALEIAPSIRWTQAWLGLLVRRALGPHVLSALRPVVARLRRIH